MAYPDAYCVKCGKHTTTQKKHTVLLNNSARALKGVCPDCASEVYKILPKTKSYQTTVDSESAYEQKFPDAYCVKCQEHTPTLNPKTIVLPNGSRAMRGTCQKCSSDSYRILGHKPLPVEKVQRPVSKKQQTHVARPKADVRHLPVARHAEVARRKPNQMANVAALLIIVSAVAGVLTYTLF